MATKRIEELPNASAISETDYIAIDQPALTVKADVAAVASRVYSSIETDIESLIDSRISEFIQNNISGDIRTTYISGCFDNNLGTSGDPAVITLSSTAPSDTKADKVWNSISESKSDDWGDTFNQLATLGGSDVSKTKIRITAAAELGPGGGDDEDSIWFDITIDWKDNEVSGVGLWNGGQSYTTSYYLKNVPILVDNDFQILETTQQATNYGLPRLSLDIVNRTITGIPVINYNLQSPQLSITIEEHYPYTL
jgi:hypothetical protein